MIAGCEDISFDLIARFHLFRVFELQLADKTLCGDAGLLEYAHVRLIDKRFSFISEADLYGAVSIVFFCLDLCYDTRACFKNSYRSKCSVLVEDLCHADLPCENCLFHLLLPPYSGLRITGAIILMGSYLVFILMSI